MTELIAIAAVVGVVALLAVVFVLRGRGQQPPKPPQQIHPQDRGGKPSATVATRPISSPATLSATPREAARVDKSVQRQPIEPATARLPVARLTPRPVVAPAPASVPVSAPAVAPAVTAKLTSVQTQPATPPFVAPPALRPPVAAPAPRPPLAPVVRAPLAPVFRAPLAPVVKAPLAPVVKAPLVEPPVVVPVIARSATPPPASPTPQAPMLPAGATLRQIAPPQAPSFDAPDTLPPPDAIPAVLLVDDSAVVRAKLKKLLDSAGYQVAIARDGLDALQLMRGRHFDLLITDLEMPNMDGAALIAAVQSKVETRAMPILAITGHEQIPAGLPVGLSSLRQVLRKPWVDADVLSQVAAAVRMAPALRQAAMV